MRSSTNADLAKGYDIVVLVAVSAGNADDPRTAMLRRRLEGEIAVLGEAGGAVELVTPDEASARAFGVNLMDYSRRAPAAEAGLQQGRAAGARLRSFWSEPALTAGP
jgi:NTE family protein